ncbi:MAG: cytochrome c [Desulfuromonadaceae bacterium]
MFFRPLILLLGGLLLWSCSSPSDPDGKAPEGLQVSRAAVRSGGKLFLMHCARCHGTIREQRRQGSNGFRTTAPDFTEPRYRQADPQVLFDTIRQGKTGMPAWAPHLSEEQTWQLVAYLRSRAANPHER